MSFWAGEFVAPHLRMGKGNARAIYYEVYKTFSFRMSKTPVIVGLERVAWQWCLSAFRTVPLLEGGKSMGSNIGQTAGVCRTLSRLAGIAGVVAMVSTSDASAQARGTMMVSAQVVSAAPARAGIHEAVQLVQKARPAVDSATRAETALAVVTLRWQRSDGPIVKAATPGSKEQPVLVASIQFLRN